MAQALVGFIPWVFYWVLSGAGQWQAAVLAGLAAGLGLVSWRWFRSRSFKTMEIVTLAFFSAHAVLSVALGLSFMRTYDAVLVGGTLALMAWGSLLAGSPFTYEYARESYPRALGPAVVPPDERDHHRGLGRYLLAQHGAGRAEPGPAGGQALARGHPAQPGGRRGHRLLSEVPRFLLCAVPSGANWPPATHGRRPLSRASGRKARTSTT